MENPWKDISWEHPIPECDWYYFALLGAMIEGVIKKVNFDFYKFTKKISKEINNTGCFFQVKQHVINLIGNNKCDLQCYVDKYVEKNQIQLNTLPEPYTGDPESEVYLLNMNPGGRDLEFEKIEYNRLKLELLTQLTLKHQLKHSMWYDLKGHDGYYWIKNRTKKILDDIGIPRYFMIEYFPYHSKKGFAFPKYMPSYDYTNYLIKKTLNRKVYVFMRKKEEWCDRLSKSISINIFHYSNTAELNNHRNVSLTRNNIKFNSSMNFDTFENLLNNNLNK